MTYFVYKYKQFSLLLYAVGDFFGTRRVYKRLKFSKCFYFAMSLNVVASSCRACGKMSPVGGHGQKMFYEPAIQITDELSSKAKVQRYLNEEFVGPCCMNKDITVKHMYSSGDLHNTYTQYKFLQNEEHLLGKDATIADLIKKYGIRNKQAYQRARTYAAM